jgi:metallo-beta-lactamase family protein
MKLTLHGAAGYVTGSAYHLQTQTANVLIDFGLFQGVPRAEHLNHVPRRLKNTHVDAVLLTHAHLDHTGRLPLLTKIGFADPIYCTPATIDLTALILRDSAKVQAQDMERLNRKRQRAGMPPLEPLYQSADVEATLPLLRPVPYDHPMQVAPGIRARYVEAGHMLGSASIEVIVQDGSHTWTIVFSGDIGPKGVPILRDAVCLPKANLVFLESTYGDRDHKPFAATVAEFEAIVKNAVERKGKMLVPTFAVGRAQLLLYLLGAMFRRGVVPKFPIYVDSPMANDATRIYFNHLDLFDEEARLWGRDRVMAEDLSVVKAVTTADESRALNDVSGPCLIMAGSGMCNAGRILHHLKQNLWRPETSVIIVGFQPEGTLGRLLVDGKKLVSIFGEKIAVQARIHTLGGFSAHAGQTELLRWFSCMAETRPRVVLTHGEERAREPLARLLKARYLLNAQLPQLGDVIEM